MTEILDNRVLWTAIIANVVAQVLKVFIVLINEKRWKPGRAFETGGMPSSHTATVTALIVGIGISKGWDSILFAAVAVYGYIVIYDATNVRRAAGDQATVLNQLVSTFENAFDEKSRPQALKTLLGHSYLQAFVGALVGIITGLISFL